jgi:phosphoribosylamine---glycine ligase
MKKILVIGKASGRLSSIVDKLHQSPQEKEIHVSTNFKNSELSSQALVIIDNSIDYSPTISYANNINPDFTIISDEYPLSIGVVDKLMAIGIPTIGPTSALAQIETSKKFCRYLMGRCFPLSSVNPKYQVFDTIDKDIKIYMKELGDFVIKPDGLTGGKGVHVRGEHFSTIREAISICKKLLSSHDSILIEEKLMGDEFSLMSFCDGNTLIHMPIVKDYKRVGEGNTGKNTGGMGSVSRAMHLSAVLDQSIVPIRIAERINIYTILGLQELTKVPYKGIIYGNYIKLKNTNTVKVIEFNARFGDPEAMNVLSLLKTDLITICEGIINGQLSHLDVQFENKYTVCKYMVPQGYPDNPKSGSVVDLSNIEPNPNLKVFWAGIETINDEQIIKGSRTVALVGIADTLAKAENIAETAAMQVKGNLFHRSDIGVI